MKIHSPDSKQIEPLLTRLTASERALRPNKAARPNPKVGQLEEDWVLRRFKVSRLSVFSLIVCDGLLRHNYKATENESPTTRQSVAKRNGARYLSETWPAHTSHTNLQDKEVNYILDEEKETFFFFYTVTVS